ncbi:MAG: protoheme IX farnesyltransferase [Ignavibacteriales bacterium]|nr:protoheme IX farnesyltransferase [Ignavibacteriales bacterium]
MNRLKKYINIFIELGKVRITFFVAFSTSAGFILANSRIDLRIFFSSIGVFLLACGSSAINHYQEKRSDGLMDRTKMRPLPSGELKESQAIIFIVSSLATGFIVLYIFTNLTAVGLGVLAVLWYNAFYTPLKKVTALAVVPGALIGSIPPMIGFVSGGGYLFNPEIIALALFFFIWQIPHFWLLLLLYDKDYEKAGFPTLTKLFTTEQLSRITYIWIVALAASCLLIPFFGIVNNLVINIFLVLSGVWLIWKTKSLLVKHSERITFRFAFREINTFVLVVVLVLTVNKLFY